MEELRLYEIVNCEENHILGYTKDYETAKSIVHKRGFWGSDATILTTILKIFNSEVDYCNWVDEENKKRMDE